MIIEDNESRQSGTGSEDHHCKNLEENIPVQQTGIGITVIGQESTVQLSARNSVPAIS